MEIITRTLFLAQKYNTYTKRMVRFGGPITYVRGREHQQTAQKILFGDIEKT